jgi:hypothetical protein
MKQIFELLHNLYVVVLFFFDHKTERDVECFMQSDLIKNNHQEHFILVRLVNTIHDENFEVESKNFLRTAFEKKQIRHLIETIFAKRESLILDIKFMHQCLH